MKKTAVVYDKWLHSLGGGEVVACTMANILKEKGYQVTIVCGKKISRAKIKQILNIDLSGIPFRYVWNDEEELKKISQGKDLFINGSFMDYSYAFAKKNIYHVHFPTRQYGILKRSILNYFLLPASSKIIKPLEFMQGPLSAGFINNQFGYNLGKTTRIAFSYVKKKRSLFKFFLFFESLSKSDLEKLSYHIWPAKIIKKKVIIDHRFNVVKFLISIEPEASTIYLDIGLKNAHKQNIYLIHSRVLNNFIVNPIYTFFQSKFENVLRAGVFKDINKRLASYQVFSANSAYVNKWISQYWKKKSITLFPPVPFIQEEQSKKKNWICSVGRFFTLGHGKKQEVLIAAFKKLYDSGYKNYELHLIGGLGKEKSSTEFAEYLKNEATDYPIFFHFNVPRKSVEHILTQSKIYWHATGFGENEQRNPVRFEHFGIAPIEAISAGCIPLLYNGGGLKEIISILHLSNRHLFNSIDELVKNSVYFIKNPHNFRKKEVGRLLEKNFSHAAFKKKFLRTIESD